MSKTKNYILSRERLFGENCYYVYGHYDGDTLVYIGKGNGARVYNNCRKHPEHCDLLTKATMDGRISEVVKILHGYLKEEDANRIESALIKAYKPKFNTAGV